MGKFFQSDKRQSGYSQIGDKTKTHGKYSDFPTKVSKKIDTLQNKIDSIVDKFKAVNRTLPLSKKKIVEKLKNQILAIKKSDKKQYEKKAKEQNLQTTANNPRLKAQMDEMNKEANKIKKLVEEGIITKGEAREKAKALRKNDGGRLGTKKNILKTKKLKVDQKKIRRKEPKDKLGNLGQNNVPTRKRGGKLRGMGIALRGGGKVMRG